MQPTQLTKSIQLKSLQFQPKSKIKAGEGNLSGLYKFFTSSSIQKKFIDEYVFEGPALIFGTGGSASVHFCDEKFSTSTDCFILKSENEEIELKYIYYYLSGNIDILEQGFKGAGLKHISKEYLGDLQIPLPPLSTQKQIIQKLDKLTELISLRKDSIKKQEDLTKSIFIEMFGDPMINEKGWEVKKMGDIIIDIKNGITRRGSYDINGSIVLRLRDIRDNFIDFSDTNKFSLTNNELKLFELNKNQILFIRVNGNPDYVGRCTVFTGYSEKVYFNDHIMRINLLGAANPVFLTRTLNDSYGKGEIKKYLKTSAGQFTISQDGLNKIQIPLPPISLQNKFAEIVQKNEENIKKQKESLEKLEELYNGVMQESFRV